MASTAVARAQRAAEDPACAAIGSLLSAEVYGLDVGRGARSRTAATTARASS